MLIPWLNPSLLLWSLEAWCLKSFMTQPLLISPASFPITLPLNPYSWLNQALYNDLPWPNVLIHIAASAWKIFFSFFNYIFQLQFKFSTISFYFQVYSIGVRQSGKSFYQPSSPGNLYSYDPQLRGQSSRTSPTNTRNYWMLSWYCPWSFQSTYFTAVIVWLLCWTVSY